MFPFGHQWDEFLNRLLSDSSISEESNSFIRCENMRTESGREGYIGKAIFLMNGGDSRDPVGYRIWMDSSLHLFALRIVDNFFDDYERECTFDEKRERIDWQRIVDGSRPNTYRSPIEEASVFLLTELVRKFGQVQGYISLADELYDTMIDVETSAENLEKRRERDLDLASLTVEPVTRLMIPYGYMPSDQVVKAIKHLSRGTRIWDHLGDLDKDIKTGAFNFVLEDAKRVCLDRPLEYIRHGLGRQYIQQAREELGRGEKCLTNQRSISVYRTLRTLMELKYGLEYVLNMGISSNGQYRRIFRKALRSF